MTERAGSTRPQLGGSCCWLLLPGRLTVLPFIQTPCLLPAACCPWRSLGSPAAAALLLTGCLWYYSGRTRLEEAILDGAFGERYRQYRHSTGRVLPRLPR